MATLQNKGHLGGEYEPMLSFYEPCKNKSCVRRNDLEEKLASRGEQVKAELEAKIQVVHKLRRKVKVIEVARPDMEIQRAFGEVLFEA